MTRTPEPMSIYHPEAATPRRIETVKARSSYVPPRPKMTWAEMAKAEGHGPNQPIEGGPGRTPQPQSTAGRIRAHLAVHGSSTSHEISNGTGIPPTRVSDALGSMQRYGSVRHADDWSNVNRKWILT